MIKKIKCLFVGTLIAFSMPVAVLAEEEGATNSVETDTTLYENVESTGDSATTLDSETTEESTENSVEVVVEETTETENEVVEESNEVNDHEDRKPMIKSNLGSKIRFEGLSSNIVIQAKSAELIISKLETMDTEVSIDELNLISAKFDELLAQLNEVDLENLDRESLKFEMDLIKDSGKEITGEFKELVSGVLSDEVKEEIREELKAVRKEIKDERKASMEVLKQELLIERTVNFLNRLDVDSTDLVSKIESGELTTKEIKVEIRELMKSVKSDKIKQIKEDRKRLDIEHKDRLEKSKKEFQERKEKFNKEMKERHNELREKYSQDREKIMKDISQNREKYQQKAGEIREKFQKVGMNPEVLEVLKNSNPELAEKIGSGELTREDVKALMDSLSEEDKLLIENIREEIKR